jgi:hypothetical protein
MQAQATTATSSLSNWGAPLQKLLTGQLSLKIAVANLILVVILDRLFDAFIFPIYAESLPRPEDGLLWDNIDAGYAPIVWTLHFAFILGSITVVVSLAAQSTPKLIDLYMENIPTLVAVWWTFACTMHDYTIKLLPELGYDVASSLVFNYHVLMPIYLLGCFPFILAVLMSTKTHAVIQNVLAGSQTLLGKVRDRREKEAYPKEQFNLFEAQNQLIDLLTYTPYKEPKAQIIEGLGDLLVEYAALKRELPANFFQIQPNIRADISFKTMQSEMETIEKTRLFFEQKSLRLIGNVYITFLENGAFDLSTLCTEQVGRLGRRAIELQDDDLISLVMVRFNTHLRFALKHALLNNEPRNLYNLIFHYGLFMDAHTCADMIDRVKTCFFYMTFYNNECFKATQQAPSVGFILDVIATEMKKVMIRVAERQWDETIHDTLLQSFLQLDNPTGAERPQIVAFFSKSHGIRLLHIGLALHYLHEGDERRARVIAQDTMQDRALLGEETFEKNMKIIFARLKFSGPTFWEDTDRGNLNIYYTPNADQLDNFAELQQQVLRASLVEEIADARVKA